LVCWGSNLELQQGGTVPGDSLPPTVVPGLSGVQQVVGGYDYTCARLSGGSITCLGNNSNGQLGDASGHRTTTIPVGW
jgi:hypothetical protein